MSHCVRPRAGAPWYVFVALIFASLALAACGNGEGENGEDVTLDMGQPDVGDVAEVSDADVGDGAGEAEAVTPVEITLSVQNPSSGQVLQGEVKLSVIAKHPAGILGVAALLNFDSLSFHTAEDEEGNEVPVPVGWQVMVPENLENDLEGPNPDTYIGLMDTTRFPAEAVDAEGNEIGGEEIPDGTYTFAVFSKPADETQPDVVRAFPVTLDNHGPVITVLQPEEGMSYAGSVTAEVLAEDSLGEVTLLSLFVGADQEEVDEKIDAATAEDADAATFNSLAEWTFELHEDPAEPYVYDYSLAEVSERSLVFGFLAVDERGNQTREYAPFNVNPIPAYRYAQQFDVQGAGEIRHVDYDQVLIGENERPLVVLATINGVFLSQLTSQGYPVHFRQLSTRRTEFVQMVRTEEGAVDRVILVELLEAGSYYVSVYGLRLEGIPALSLRPLVRHKVLGEVTTVFFGDIIGPPVADGGFPDFAIGTEAKETGVQLFKGVSRKEPDEEIPFPAGGLPEPTDDVVDGEDVVDSEDVVESEEIIDDEDVVEAEEVIEGDETEEPPPSELPPPAAPAPAPTPLAAPAPDEEPLPQDLVGEPMLDAGWFKPLMTVLAGPEGTRDVKAADIDGDGLNDIVIGLEGANGFRVVLQISDGETTYFAMPQTVLPRAGSGDPLPAEDMVSLIVYDFSTDTSVPEIMIVSRASNFVAELQRSALSTPSTHKYSALPMFGAAADRALVGNEPAHLAMGDLTEDGKPDVVVVNRGSGNVTLMRNFGSGQFPRADMTFYNVGANPLRAYLFDLDQDEHLDVIVTHAGSEHYSWLANYEGDGNLAGAVDVPAPAMPQDESKRLKPIRFGAASVRHVGNDDVVMVTEAITEVTEVEVDGVVETSTETFYPLWFYESKGINAQEGVATVPVRSKTLPTQLPVTDMAIANVAMGDQMDVLLTFLTACGGEEDQLREGLQIMTYSTAGAPGEFVPMVSIDGGGPIYRASPVGVATAKLSSPDSTTEDVVLIHRQSGTPGDDTYCAPRLVSYSASSVSSGQNPLKEKTNHDETRGMGMDPVDLLLAKRNDDDFYDALVANAGNKDVSRFEWTGGASFGTGVSPFFVGGEPVALADADWDDDGKRDLIILLEDNLAVAYGIGLGLYTPPAYFHGENAITLPFPANDPVDILVSDTNQDCLEDIVILDKARSQFFVYLATGGKAPGAFVPNPAVGFPTGTGPIQIVTGNFDGDLCEDLAVLNEQGRSFTLLINSKCSADDIPDCMKE
jgi:hypothetical protein